MLTRAPGGGASRLLSLDETGLRVVVAEGLRAPAGFFLGSGGAWGDALYLTDAGEGQLLRLEATGTNTVLRKGLSGPRGIRLRPRRESLRGRVVRRLGE